MLSPFQRRKLIRRFQTYDHDRKGYLCWEDIERVLLQVLSMSGWSMNAPERQAFLLQGRTGWQLLAAAADVDANGQVDQEEWLNFYDAHVLQHSGDGGYPQGALPEWLDTLIMLSFSAMDADGNGVISLEEYQRYQRAHGFTDLDTIQEGFAAIDTNSDGTLSAEEWRRLSIDFYLGDDPKAASTWLWGDIYRGLFK
ncbi:MAG: EF-hand domain-containing protein [Myxococcota bacterium]